MSEILTYCCHSVNAKGLLAVFWSVTFPLSMKNGCSMNNAVNLEEKILKAFLRAELLRVFSPSSKASSPNSMSLLQLVSL